MIQTLPSSVVACVVLCSTMVLAADRPNVIILYADDLGYGDVQCNNPDRGKIETPSIDGLAERGMRFTDGHSSSGVCSPSRYALLTGRYHWRTRLQKGIVSTWGPPLIAPDRLTIASLLQRAGYRTACIGKWHLGWDWPIDPDSKPLFTGGTREDMPVTPEHLAAWKKTFSQEIPGGPTTRGFETYFGTDVPNWPPYCFIENNRTLGIPSAFLPAQLFQKNQAGVKGPALVDWTLEPILPALRDRARAFIEESFAQDRPFFLYMPLTAPHTPLAVNAPYKGQTGLNLYADFVRETDSIVGDILNCVGTQPDGIDNTLIFFTSDNGCAPYIGAQELEQKGHYPSGPLRGYKSDAWEGGHRVPFIVSWPGKVAAGTVCDQLVHQTDIMATISDCLDIAIPPEAAEDSVSLLPLLQGGKTPVRETAVSHSAQGLPTIRKGPWKMIFGKGSGGWSKGQDTQAGQLYHLQEDIGETRNLYAQRPDLVEELTKLMEQTVSNGRSTPGPHQQNDVLVNWRQYYQP